MGEYAKGFNDGLEAGAGFERKRIAQILMALGEHGITHSERCFPHHWVVEKALELISETDHE